MNLPAITTSKLRAQSGLVAVEFALIASVFFMMLLGAAEFGRMLWMWNAAADATRMGARMAVVCDLNDADIKTRMRAMVPGLTNANITLTYAPAGCSATSCQTVTVSLTGYVFNSFIPVVSIQPALPPFTTTLPREYMTSASNPACT